MFKSRELPRNELVVIGGTLAIVDLFYRIFLHGAHAMSEWRFHSKRLPIECPRKPNLLMLICSSVDFFLQICRHILLAQKFCFFVVFVSQIKFVDCWSVDLAICRFINLAGKINRSIDRQIWILWTCWLFPRGKIEVSDSQGESLRKILYQAYNMSILLKFVDMSTNFKSVYLSICRQKKMTDQQTNLVFWDIDLKFVDMSTNFKSVDLSILPAILKNPQIDRSTINKFGFLGLSNKTVLVLRSVLTT